MAPEPYIPSSVFRLTRPTETVTILFEGTPIRVPHNVSLAAALLLSGYPAGRWASRSSGQRSVYCGIGQCFDCIMIIDGTPCRQACMTRVRDGMSVARQRS